MQIRQSYLVWGIKTSACQARVWRTGISGKKPSSLAFLVCLICGLGHRLPKPPFSFSFANVIIWTLFSTGILLCKDSPDNLSSLSKYLYTSFLTALWGGVWTRPPLNWNDVTIRKLGYWFFQLDFGNRIMSTIGTTDRKQENHSVVSFVFLFEADNFARAFEYLGTEFGSAISYVTITWFAHLYTGKQLPRFVIALNNPFLTLNRQQMHCYLKNHKSLLN